ncbi:SNARE Ykt6 [Coccidioides immitis RMSCC 3703]|uniref:Synaptobrevin homolog YKT6 n=1 Tax=Coccidioides immitis RMSCC 3703 TaxID=454286 RepID=A0A0J8TH05_COCIT|nr:SNARE Ykt6 [Coccidioides immitis RMSCC 3703]
MHFRSRKFTQIREFDADSTEMERWAGENQTPPEQRSSSRTRDYALYRLLSKVVDEFLAKYPRTAFAAPDVGNLPFPQLKEYITKYQDPSQADSIMKIQKELDETKIVLHKTIESVLERGEKIDSLVAKSDGLSAQSKMFYGQAKKQNTCCVVM